MRFGIKPPLITGLRLMTVALLCSRVAGRRQLGDRHPPGDARGGLGAGIAFNPPARGDERRPQEQAGLASGVVNTAFMMGGAVGLAILASLADRRTETLLASDDGSRGAARRLPRGLRRRRDLHRSGGDRRRSAAPGRGAAGARPGGEDPARPRPSKDWWRPSTAELAPAPRTTR